MKVDRLIGILSILLQKESTTAPELAQHFEVSRRTINRDLETLCQAGIPIVTRQGQGGGISIMDGYRMERTLLTSQEMLDIVAGLRSLDSVNETKRYVQLMEKLSVNSSDIKEGRQSVLIDLSSWYPTALAPKIECIRSAIDSKRELAFLYYSPHRESRRQIEPYYLIFQWSSWYVWGWCKQRQDFRLFKLNRMDDVALLDNTFAGRPCPLPELGDEHVFAGGIDIKALFLPEYKWRLVEEYGPYCYTLQDDGRLLLQTSFTNKDYLMEWIFSFRDGVELVEPVELRAEIQQRIEAMRQIYEKTGGMETDEI